MFFRSPKLQEMREKVNLELSHIPRGDEHQNMVRVFYNTMRMNSLGKKANYPDDRNKILEFVINNVKELAAKEGQNFEAKYDKDFFDGLNGKI